jgi:hypothetical protein
LPATFRELLVAINGLARLEIQRQRRNFTISVTHPKAMGLVGQRASGDRGRNELPTIEV